MQYITLADARSLECNGCGDCCDSARTDGYWTWGELPTDQYRSMYGGEPLIIPLARTDEGWVERPREDADGSAYTPTRFRCAALRPQPDGRGLCGIHDQDRPPRCDEFPVKVIGLEEELEECGEFLLTTSAFPRCTWYQMTIVRDDDPRLNFDPGAAEETHGP